MWRQSRWLVVVTVFAAATANPLLQAQEIRFRDVTKQAGLYQPLLGIMGHGGAWGDVDGDGRIDLYVGGFADRPDAAYAPADGPPRNRLFRNLGGGRFEVWKQPAVEFFARTSGAVFADLDNNGTLELYVANNCKGRTSRETEPQRTAQLTYSKLFRNDDGTLVDITEPSGACPKSIGTARNIGVFDYDRDGLLDLLVLEDRFTRDPDTTLFRNMGELKFRDVTEEAGLPTDMHGLGLAVADLNGDGRPDFFVGHSNRLFLSSGDGRYREHQEHRKLFAWEPLNAEDWPCGAAFGDLNRDGRLDLVIGIHGERARNRVYLNTGMKQGVPQFRDVSQEVGMPAELNNKSPHVEIQDFDNDGRMDIYFSTAWLAEDGSVTPMIFRNRGNRNGLPRFDPIREIRPDEQLVYYSTGPSGDYDNDGRIDLFLVNWFRGNHCRLLHNESPRNHWLAVQVIGRAMNRMGIGAQIRVYRAGHARNAESLLGFQEVSTGYGYAAGQPAVCHFGLGDTENVDVQIRLPDGHIVERSGLSADRRVVVEME